MTRKASSSAVQEELYPLPGEAREREPFDDSRLLDLEAEQESPFLRGQKRVSVRRGSLPKQTANRLKWVALAVFVLAIFGTASAMLYRYGKHSWRFRIASSDQIEISGAQHVTHAQIMEVMGGDIGRNIFFVPLSQRKQQLEQIPWVESASVMRFVPNRLGIEIHERTPVAFARIGSRISLIDAGGTVMDLAPSGKRKYSFPVIAGMNAGEPLSTRAARMRNYNELVQQLDSDGASYSRELSEVDLTDPEDVKVVVADPNGEVLVHLGSGSYLQRYKTYVTHVQQWRQQFDKLESVDLRYDGQIIVNPDLEGIRRPAVLTPAAAKAAMAAGVKPAAIVNYEKYVTHPTPLAPTKKPPKPAAKAKAKPVVHRAALKPKAKQATAAIPKNAGAPWRAVTAPASVKTPKPESAKTSKPAATVALPPAQASKAAPTVALPPAQTSKPAPTVASPLAVGVSQKKPSPAIPKEASQNPR
ncbi:MAG: FtsQ-type POTRA domain-containing protein [Acidobacteriales bacterium]|nr:FtsQ-type POTRA domain-containing protein [Candidatus Koribacter versatilis]MBI3647038.1 FtsQ-type POTRA domain-containing protein [Terriglobales bacterium]